MQINVVTETWVPGRPATKGSLDAVPRADGSFYMRESVQGSKDWRRLVAQAIREDRQAHGLVEPTRTAVGVRVLFVLPVPVGLAGQDIPLTDASPTLAGAGDVDKLSRNVLDALKDAGAYADDNQVCKLLAGKVYADGVSAGSAHHGAFVQCWELLPWELRALRGVQLLRALTP